MMEITEPFNDQFFEALGPKLQIPDYSKISDQPYNMYESIFVYRYGDFMLGSCIKMFPDTNRQDGTYRLFQQRFKANTPALNYSIPDRVKIHMNFGIEHLQYVDQAKLNANWEFIGPGIWMPPTGIAIEASKIAKEYANQQLITRV
ncbi:MAG: hypothetical protein ACQETE_01675 [Bacteroidota bacterium]